MTQNLQAAACRVVVILLLGLLCLGGVVLGVFLSKTKNEPTPEDPEKSSLQPQINSL